MAGRDCGHAAVGQGIGEPGFSDEESHDHRPVGRFARVRRQLVAAVHCRAAAMTAPVSRPSLSRQRGMGIVELMVALLIGLIMAVALAWFYLGSRTLSRASEDVSRLQESGRNA